MKKQLEAETSVSHVAKEVNFHHGSMLIDDEPMLVLPKLAMAIGLDEAIVVQQLHFWLKPSNRSGRMINGEKWIFNTYEQWQQHFPWWSIIHLKRIFGFLEKTGIVLSCQPEGGISRRKYYRLNQAVVMRLRNGTFPIEARTKRISKSRPSDQLDTMGGSIRPLPSTESTCRENKQREKVKDIICHDEGNISIPSQWKPKQPHLSKEQQLARLPNPATLPSEVEFEAFLDETEDGHLITEYRPDLYWQLCTAKWHQWKEHLHKWIPIRNWKKYVAALTSTISEEFENL
jgi:hypothetical protein